MENGAWEMENGKWKMENGKWKRRLAAPFFECNRVWLPLAVTRQTSYQLPFTIFRFNSGSERSPR